MKKCKLKLEDFSSRFHPHFFGEFQSCHCRMDLLFFRYSLRRVIDLHNNYRAMYGIANINKNYQLISIKYII
jgi:hypothetical protein